MKKSKKIIFTILLCFCAINLSMSQEIDKKYLVSIIHLQSNHSLDKEIRFCFKKMVPKKGPVLYKFSKEISFIDIGVFKKDLKEYSGKLPFDVRVLETKGKFKSKFNFEPHSNEFDKLLPTNNNGLILHFSKPIKNILILEISKSDMYSSAIKFGKGLRILLMFNDEGFVEKTFTKNIVYN